jgi:uncharacterized protein (DUF2252 family)
MTTDVAEAESSPVLAERLAAGKSRRRTTPRSAHAHWKPTADRPDPVALLEESSRGRLPDLVPLRYGRMLPTPFTFLRGSAAAMACDLAAGPSSVVTVQLCGDAHLLNFGVFASPERHVLFDLVDFDETLPGPFEWDVKRLAASCVCAGRDSGLGEPACADAARAAARAYRIHIREYARLRALDVWYARIDFQTLIDRAPNRLVRRQREQTLLQAAKSTAEHAFPKLTGVLDGHRRILDHPPSICHSQDGSFEAQMRCCLDHYQATLSDDRRALLNRFRFVDAALKVVGVGSVGTRCAVALMLADDHDPLFLQIKEAQPSALAPHAGASAYAHQGQRVVCGQKLMQSATDIFLGWGDDATAGHQFYVRQLRDMKGSVNVAELSAAGLADYAAVCGWALARAHAKAGAAAEVAGYLGRSDQFDRAVAHFAIAYADQTERDHAAFAAAVREGRLAAVTG